MKAKYPFIELGIYLFVNVLFILKYLPRYSTAPPPF